MTRIDWTLVRDTFVKGADDYNVLAKRFGISRQSIELKASPKNEHWQLLRQQYRERHNSQAEVQAPSCSAVESETESLPVSETFVVPALGSELSFTDIDGLVNSAIVRLHSQIQTTEARSLEKSAEVFSQLIDLKLRLQPPTPREWMLLAMEYRIPAEELFTQLKEAFDD